MKRVLITGGAGLIGSHLASALLQDGVRVLVVDRRQWSDSPILMAATGALDYVQADVTDSPMMGNCIRDFEPDTLFNLAAQPLSAKSNVDPLGTANDNIMGTYAVLEAVRQCAPTIRVVHGSTACFYGVPLSPPPLDEDDSPAVGHYVYTATKIAADYAVQHYRHIYQIPAVCVRMVNVYGPGDTHLERIIPRMILQAIAGEAPTLTQSDGSDVLSFLHVGDVVRALLMLGESDKALGRRVWNLGGMEPVSISDLAQTVFLLAGRVPQEFTAVGPRAGAPVHKYLSGRRIFEALGFKPAIELRSGLESTIRWYEKWSAAYTAPTVVAAAHPR